VTPQDDIQSKVKGWERHREVDDLSPAPLEMYYPGIWGTGERLPNSGAVLVSLLKKQSSRGEEESEQTK